jgi:hypothetical protein
MKKRATVADPPPPVSITDQIKGMKIGTSQLFANSPPHSIRAMVSRIRTESSMDFTTKAEGDGTRVWRLS